MTSDNLQEFKYAKSFRRSFASAIDLLIVNVLRIIFVTIAGNYWLKPIIIDFRIKFKEKFETEIIGQDPERLSFITNHDVFWAVILFCFATLMVGGLYHMILNSSSWRGTIGKKIMKIAIVKNNGDNLTFLESSAHYFLSLAPWIFVIYILAHQFYHGIGIYDAIAGNMFNLLLGLATLAWLQIHLITKKKTTAYDMICDTVVIENFTKKNN